MTPRADAIVTPCPGLAIGVARRTAVRSCSPIGDAGIVGAAHAGWKGALTGVLEGDHRGDGKARRRAGAHQCGDRPLIRQPNYEVGAENSSTLHGGMRREGKFFKPAARENHAVFDLPGYIKARLERTEIESVEDLGLCTYAEPARFFSYRRTTHRGEPDTAVTSMPVHS